MIDSDHAPDPPSPESGGVDEMFRGDRSEFCLQSPPVGFAIDARDPVVLDHLGAPEPRRLGVGVGRAVGVEIALERIEQRSEDARGVDDRHHSGRFLRREQGGVGAHHAEPLQLRSQPPPSLGRAGQLHPAAHVQADAATALLLDLRVETDRVLLERGDPSVAVHRMEAAGGVPRGTGRQFVAFDQRDIAHASKREVIQDAAAHDAAADHDDPIPVLHARDLPPPGEPAECMRRPNGAT